MIPDLTISAAEAMNPSRRNTMEDVHVTHSPGTWGCNDKEMTFIGVYDGHGGRDIVDFLEGRLHEQIAEELNMIDDDNGDDDGDINDASTHVKIERAFLMTDAESKMAGIETSGATVAVCLVKKHANGRKITIHSANAGDARIVLSCQPTSSSPSPLTLTTTATATATESTSNDNEYLNSPSPKSKRLRQQQILLPKAHRLTFDHKSDNIDEINRIEKAGGFLLRNRVLGIMAVARSLGDHGMKEYVIGRPFINTTEIDLDKHLTPINNSGSTSTSSISSLPSSDVFNSEFVIVGCDGIWDVIEDQEAVDLVRRYVKNGSLRDGERQKYKETAAKMLCQEALDRGTSDNVTILVVWF